MDVLDVYPLNFEDKIGFSAIRESLFKRCSSSLGRGVIANVKAISDFETIQRLLSEAKEMCQILESDHTLPNLQLLDCREELQCIRPERTYMEEASLVELSQMLVSLHTWTKLFLHETSLGSIDDESHTYLYPHLSTIYADAPSFPQIEHSLHKLLDAEGKIRDTASRELMMIRQALRETERSLSGLLNRILRTAKSEGWVEPDTQPNVRDGRLVLPISPQYKRKIKGIVYDESASGKTVFIEPIELVEANNRIRDLERQERKEVVRILIEIANKIRPNIKHLLKAYDILAYTDAVLAKAKWAKDYTAISPNIVNKPYLHWYDAKHPLLMKSLATQGGEIVPLDIRLDAEEGRILIISGPNAGGKSVCLKTVGLLQYMLQCGLPIPLSEHSQAGIFTHIFLDIGDEQSIEDDLSTYSSHLRNMKHFERYANPRSLLLIDEFGGGTEPTIGGAIAQALLQSFNQSKSYGVITTHYQNLKTFADETKGLSNGAMLYDRHEMRPLFTLSIGRPGSSFAIEIARKIGLPEMIIEQASQIVGSDYISLDKYLQDIVRDKRYWEQKRQNIRKEERKLQEAAERYTNEADETERRRKGIIEQAKKEAQKIVQEANAKIERTIKEIREVEAERELTLGIRQSLKAYQEQLAEEEVVDTQAKERAKREVEKLLRRRERKVSSEQLKDKEEVIARGFRQANLINRGDVCTNQDTEQSQWSVGDTVKLVGQQSLGTILEIGTKGATIAFGSIKMTMPLSKLQAVTKEQLIRQKARSINKSSHSIIEQIHDKRLHFKPEIDVRGMRVGEGVDTVRSFVDDALQLGIDKLRILHGTGTGALKQAIRAYLSTVRSIKHISDEHIQLGGAGVTIVEL